MTDKSDDRVGHLNTILVRGDGNLKDPIFQSSSARALPGGMLKLRVDRRITVVDNFVFNHFNSSKLLLKIKKKSVVCISRGRHP